MPPDDDRRERRRQRGIRLQKRTLGLTRHWLRALIVFLLIFTGLPFAAPVLMAVGATGPADLIYTVYSPMCHQFAFRSWFFFGEQAAYPREAANVPGLVPFEAAAGNDPYFDQYFANPSQDMLQWSVPLMNAARGFTGNAQLGYKTAVCERDIAIYSGLTFGALIFAVPFVRKRLRPAPVLLYIFLGLGPIGLDGFSQLLSYANFWPIRESTPLLRTITGLLFGLMNAWLAFPYLEMSMRETEVELTERLRSVGEDI